MRETQHDLQDRGQRCCHDGSKAITLGDELPEADALLLPIPRQLPVRPLADGAYCLVRPLPGNELHSRGVQINYLHDCCGYRYQLLMTCPARLMDENTWPGATSFGADGANVERPVQPGVVSPFNS